MRRFLPILSLLIVLLSVGVCDNAFADFTIEAGENFALTAAETLTIDGALAIQAAGTLDASAGGTNIIVNINWSNSGTFTAGDGTATFIDSTRVTIISGNTTFNNFTCETASKQLTFQAGSTQTVSSTLTLDGQDSTTQILLRSTVSGTRWTFDVTGGAQSVNYLDVQDSSASSNDIEALNSNNSGNNDDTEATPHWIFKDSIYITSPGAGFTVGRETTVIGYTTEPSTDFEIRGTSGGSVVTVASGTSGSSGDYDFRVEVDPSTPLDLGANSLRPVVVASGNMGPAVGIPVVASPTPAQVPTIDIPVEDAVITSNPFAVSGEAVADTEVRIQALDVNSDVILNCGSTTSDGAGAYTISCDAVANALKAGANILTVTTYDATGNPMTTSAYRNVRFTDPFGIIFDSVSDNPVGSATVTLYYDNDPGVGRDWIVAQKGAHFEDDGTTENPQTVGADGFYSYNCIDGDFYIDISAAGYKYPTEKADAELPAGRAVVTGSRGEPFTITGIVVNMDHPADPTGALLKIEKTANKKEVTVGDIVTYTVTIENIVAADVTNVYLEDKLPAGFKYLSGKAILDNAPASDPEGNRPVNFNIGTVSTGQTRILRYQLIVGSGVTFGKYENRAFAKYTTGTVISNHSTETVKVIPDPLFDLGTVIGKVFNDANENGVQDPGEEPVAGARIVTEDGIFITVGGDGKYHLQAIIPGRHLFRLDERTLPEGAYLTTDKAVVVNVTPGILRKVNFGVKVPEGQTTAERPFVVSQDRGMPGARLNVACYVRRGGEPEYEFRMFTNYQLFMKRWKLEILEEGTRRVVKTFNGTRDDIFEPIYWNGETYDGRPVEEDREYVYRVKVTGAGAMEDVTAERPLDVIPPASKKESKAGTEAYDARRMRAEYEKWVKEESRKNNLEKQAIRVQGEAVRIASVKPWVSSVRVVKSGKTQADVPVIGMAALTAKDLLEGGGQIKDRPASDGIEIILPKGDYQIQGIAGGRGEFGVRSSGFGVDASGCHPERGSEATESKDLQGVALAKDDKEGGELGVERGDRSSPGETYSKHVKVGDDYLFLVAMADAEMGYSFNRGNIEPVGQDEKFEEGFWAEGKLAYTLKGKILGKYLITSSLDTRREKKELFRNLDPDKYYAVYGDEASIDYGAANTQGMLYLLIEWDKSRIIWGDYETAFTDTEFSRFSRTLYGGKLHYESVSATRFGEPRTKLICFKAVIKQKAAHNELLGTGGSLYYLKHKYVVEGSEKVKVEIRDKITGLVLGAEEMKEGVDYEIDYTNGRIIFWQPVGQVSESSLIISSDLLDGNPVYVVADYEYETKDKYKEGSFGGRVQQALSDYLMVGATYVNEEQQKEDFELVGADATLRLSEGMQFTAEYAETRSEEAGNFISTDGGLTFTELATSELADGKAYGLKGEAHLLNNRLALFGYYKQIGSGFSSPDTSSQQGKELLGFGANIDFTGNTKLRLSHDIQKLIDDGNPQTRLQVGADTTATTTAHVTHESGRLKLTGEYRHQEVAEKKEEFESETNAEEDTVGARAEYKLNEKIELSLEQQATLKGRPNHQTTVGIAGKVFEWLSLKGEQTIGTDGTATSAGATAELTDRLSITGERTIARLKTGQIDKVSSLSGSVKTDENTEVHLTCAVSDSTVEENIRSVTCGMTRKINDEVEATMDRTFASAKDRITQGSSFALAHEKDGTRLEGTFSREYSENPDTGERKYASSIGVVREIDGRRLEGTFTKQHSENASEISNTNIFGLSGDINDSWAVSADFERGVVQSHDGERVTRNAGSMGIGYVLKDPATGDIRFKASNKIEIRYDEGDEDTRQYLVRFAAEGKLNPDTTVFTKAHMSHTRNITTRTTQAMYKELVTGVAYRPVYHDRLNLLAKYTYLEDDSPPGQSDFKDIEKERVHVLAGEAVYDITDKWQATEKLALKMGEEKVTGFDFTGTQTWLWINRLGYNINRDWRIAGEYRILAQIQARDYKQGALFEITRNIGDFVQVSAGYNFTDFTDDLTDLDYTAHGPFVRITGKFYDRTPEEIERARKRREEERIQAWAWQLANDELASPDSAAGREIYRYLRLADELREEGRPGEAKELYERVARMITIIYNRAEEYVRRCIDREKRLKGYDERASRCYKEGRLPEAKELWQKMLEEAEPEPVSLEF